MIIFVFFSILRKTNWPAIRVETNYSFLFIPAPFIFCIGVLIYSIVGLISALAGILYVARLGSSQSAIGENWPMNSIASSVSGIVTIYEDDDDAVLERMKRTMEYLRRELSA